MSGNLSRAKVFSTCSEVALNGLARLSAGHLQCAVRVAGRDGQLNELHPQQQILSGGSTSQGLHLSHLITAKWDSCRCFCSKLLPGMLMLDDE